MKISLDRKNNHLSNNTVHKYMNCEMNLYYISCRKKPGYKKGILHKLFPNLLNSNFVVNEPNYVWCTNFTYLYLANRKFITSDLEILKLDKVIHSQHCNASRLILHSDQGMQFSSAAFTSFCYTWGVTQSMSRSETPYDNIRLSVITIQ